MNYLEFEKSFLASVEKANIRQQQFHDAKQKSFNNKSMKKMRFYHEEKKKSGAYLVMLLKINGFLKNTEREQGKMIYLVSHFLHYETQWRKWAEKNTLRLKNLFLMAKLFIC